MRKAILGPVLLAMSIACTGCSGGGDGEGSGGSGGSGGPATAFSFDAETSEQAAEGAAVATELATRVGSIVSGLFGALADGAGAASLGAGLKDNIPIPPICTAGTAKLDWQRSGLDLDLSAGDIVTLTLDDCSGSPVSTMPANGTITLTMTDVGGGLPVIGGIITAIASLDLSIAPDTTITGDFALHANLPSLALANLFFGAREDSDLITVTEGFFQMQLACFDIYQRVGLAGPGIEFFRPLGVLNLSNQVFTLNNYEETPDNILFDFAGFDATPRSGSLTLTSGDRSGGLCSSFSGDPTPNESFVTVTFTGGGCVTLEGTDTEGVPFSLVRTWDSLLEVGTPGGPGDSCGTGGTGGGAPTGATPSPVDCPAGSDIVASADAYIRGGTHALTSFGTASNLLVKGVQDLEFARKFYVVFDLSTAPESFSKASLILTLERHVGRTPVSLYGIVDNDDWDPSTIAENAINWDNAPRNNKLAGNLFEMSDGVRLLVDRYDLDLPDPAEDPDPEGTQYSLDVTDYVQWALGNKPDFSSVSPEDQEISMLFAIPGLEIVDGSAFKSLDIPDEAMCARPFLHFE